MTLASQVGQLRDSIQIQQATHNMKQERQLMAKTGMGFSKTPASFKQLPAPKLAAMPGKFHVGSTDHLRVPRGGIAFRSNADLNSPNVSVRHPRLGVISC
jgi:hypothetical protein